MPDALPRPEPVALRRPCSTSITAVDRSGLRVPFARCGDGIARHVGRVGGPEDGPFLCLDCEEPLSLRRIRGKRTHFSHRADSQCAGETALHRFAKELLARERTFTFPSLILRSDKVAETVFQGGRVDLDDVQIEVGEDGFQPDAVVRVGDQLRAIEFKVAHAVNDEKAAKVRKRDYPMIEIELSSLRALGLDAEELEEAILHSSPRAWIHHPQSAAGRERLAVRVKQAVEVRGSRPRHHIEKRPRSAIVPDGWYKATSHALPRSGSTISSASPKTIRIGSRCRRRSGRRRSSIRW